MTRKAATEDTRSRADGLGFHREKSLHTDNVFVGRQKLLILIIFHHWSLRPSVAVFTTCAVDDGGL